MKIFKRFMFVLSIILFTFLIMLSILGNFLYNYAISAKTSKKDILNKNSETEEIGKDNLTEEKIFEKWLTANTQSVYITSNDGLKLHSYEGMHVDTDKWVIIVHGYASQGLEMGDFAEIFFNKGYNILVVDLRGAGLSDGDYIGMGWKDRLDILNWINYIVDKSKESQIILFGVSMGASTVMMTTGETLPNNVKLAIEDSGYTSVCEEFEYQLDKIFKLKAFPFLNVASITTKVRAGYFLEEASAVKQLKNAKVPILFIHGSLDNFVPFYMLEKNFNSANAPKEKLVIENAGHIRASKVDPEKYWKTVEDFIEKYINL